MNKLVALSCSLLASCVISGDPGEDSQDGLPFQPSNIGSDTPAMLGDLVITDRDCAANTETGQIDCLPSDDPSYQFTHVTQADGSQLAVFWARSIRIEQSAKLSAYGAYPLVLVALADFTIAGNAWANAEESYGTGGGFQVTSLEDAGSGPGGGPARTQASGGGGGSFCGIGGSGGGTTLRGTTYGSPSLSPLVAGSSGGGGGAGGGAIQLVAGNRLNLTSTGVIHVGGGGGIFDTGGGSGGAILIEASTVTLDGVLAANGGAGGGYDGAAGADAYPSDQPAGSLGTGPAYGVGSSASTIDGLAGVEPPTLDYVGGGGGGAGRIRVNTPDAQATFAMVSPSADTPCVTVGKLSL